MIYSIHLDHYVTVANDTIALINEKSGTCIVMTYDEFTKLLNQTREIEFRIGGCSPPPDMGNLELKLGPGTYLIIETMEDTVSIMQGCRCDDHGIHPAMKMIKLRKFEWHTLLNLATYEILKERSHKIGEAERLIEDLKKFEAERKWAQCCNHHNPSEDDASF